MITVVSGLPRSGTSMMMQMLVAGGLQAVTDGQRQADEDNPRGYFEVERVKRLRDDASWLAEAEGKVVKAITMLLRDLPASRTYKVIFMLRDLDEVLASQAAMLQRRGKPRGAADAEMKRMFEAHLTEIRGWLKSQAHVQVLYCSHRETIQDPRRTADAVAAFLGVPLDVAAMTAAVDRSLYRNRAPSAPTA